MIKKQFKAFKVPYGKWLYFSCRCCCCPFFNFCSANFSFDEKVPSMLIEYPLIRPKMLISFVLHNITKRLCGISMKKAFYMLSLLPNCLFLRFNLLFGLMLMFINIFNCFPPIYFRLVNNKGIPKWEIWKKQQQKIKETYFRMIFLEIPMRKCLKMHWDGAFFQTIWLAA